MTPGGAACVCDPNTQKAETVRETEWELKKREGDGIGGDEEDADGAADGGSDDKKA